MYPDCNRTTRGDIQKLSAALTALHATNGVCPFSLGIDGRTVRTFVSTPAQTSERPDATMIRTQTVGMVSDGLQMTIDATEYLDFPVYEYLVTIRNLSSQKSPLLTDIYAADVVLPADTPVLFSNNGDFYSADGYRQSKQNLDSETHVITPHGGRPCDRAFPYFRVLGKEGGYNLAIGWPGQWQAEFSAAGTGFRFAAKQQYTALRLLPGEIYRAPRITVMAFEGGETRAVNLWRRWYLAHILPRSGGTALSPMMNMCHPAGDEEFTHATEENQIDAIDRFMARGFKPDIWWLDAGWYPCKDEEGVRRWWRTGDWRPDPERFPNGLGPVGKKCEEHGIKFLLWFEPERIKLDYRSPDLPERFILYKEEDCDGTRRQSDLGLLNLGDPECLAWLTQHVDTLIKDGHIGIYRQDFNFEPLEYWLQADEEERLGMTENRHIQGYLAYWDTLLAQNPGLVIDSCASGGRRNDLETMRRSVTLHPTDYGYGNPPVKQAFYGALHAWIPYFRAFTEVYCEENGEYHSGRPDPRGIDSYALHTGLGTAVHCSCLCDSDEETFARIRTFAQTVWRPAAEYMLSADYYPLTMPNRSIRDWCVYAFHDPKTDSGFVHAVRNAHNEEDRKTVQLAFLDPIRTYAFSNRETGEKQIVSGEHISKNGMEFCLAPRSGAVWFFHPVTTD